MKQLEHQLSKLYKDFFEKLKIEFNGDLNNERFVDWKFAAYPFIGTYFGHHKCPRIVFIGLDIGSDERKGKIIDFNYRRNSIENNKTYNPHIAGTFMVAVYFLVGSLIQKYIWNQVKNEKSYNAAIKKLRHILEEDFDAMAYTSFTNYYKFVTKHRKSRMGGANRKNVNKELEDKLLLDELMILKPDILIFQSFEFKNKKYCDLLYKITKQHKETDIWIAPHPSWRGSRIPDEYIRQFQKINIL